MAKRGSSEWCLKISRSKDKFRVKFKCDYCGADREERQSHFKKKKRHFCDMNCYSCFRSEKLPKHEQHAFKNGGMSDSERRLRIKSRSDLNHAIRDGKLKRLPCRDCGSAKVEAHHTDYFKPLEVIWLCDPCHHKEHENPSLLSPKKSEEGEANCTDPKCSCENC